MFQGTGTSCDGWGTHLSSGDGELLLTQLAVAGVLVLQPNLPPLRQSLKTGTSSRCGELPQQHQKDQLLYLKSFVGFFDVLNPHFGSDDRNETSGC